MLKWTILTILLAAQVSLTNCRTVPVKVNGAVVGSQDDFTELESEKIKVWKIFPLVLLKRQIQEDIQVPIRLDIFDIIQASLRPLDQTASPQSTCRLLTDHDDATAADSQPLDTATHTAAVRSIDADVYTLDSGCVVRLTTAAGLAGDGRPVDVGRLDVQSCVNVDDDVTNQFDAYVMAKAGVLGGSEIVQMRDGDLIDQAGNTIVENVAKFRYVYNDPTAIVDSYDSHKECILCEDRLFPLQWSLKDHSLLMEAGQMKIKGIIAASNHSLVFANLQSIPEDKKYSHQILGSNISNVVSLMVEENNFVVYTQSSFRSEPDMTLCSIFLASISCQTISQNEFIQITPSVSSILKSKSAQRNIKRATRHPSTITTKLWCPPVSLDAQDDTPTEYQLNLTLKNCPEKLHNQLHLTDLCHYSLLLRVQTDFPTAFLTPGFLKISFLTLLIFTLCIVGYTLKLRQMLQNHKLMIEIAQIELDTMKLTVEYADKVKPFDNAIDELGEADFEPYSEQ